MRVAVTGGCGFIGSHIVERLLRRGDEVVVVDNLSSGQRQFLGPILIDGQVTFFERDVKDLEGLTSAFQGCSEVYHLAANADVRFGPDHPRRDLDENTIGTFNVLEAMRRNGASRIVFSSTGSIYGEPEVFPTPEHAPFPVQTSLYGASKLAGEGLIQAYSQAFGIQAYIFRFVSILGERYSHGHVFDFLRSLRANPSVLKILGNGLQKKSYLYVGDCVEAVFLAMERSKDPVNIFNLGTDEYCQVNDSIGWICSRLGVAPERVYTGGERGWVGDSPFIFLDTAKIRSLGWRPSLTIREGIVRTVDYLLANNWLLDSRE